MPHVSLVPAQQELPQLSKLASMSRSRPLGSQDGETPSSVGVKPPRGDRLVPRISLRTFDVAPAKIYRQLFGQEPFTDDSGGLVPTR